MILQTSRLYLRELDVSDVHFVYELMNSPGWLTNIGDRGISSIEKAKEYIENKYLPSYKEGLGNFGVVEKSDNRLIGSCGLYKRDTLDYPDIGFAFLPEYFGKGYAFESAMALKNYAIQDLQLKRLYGFTLPSNEPSKKLLVKIGLELKGTYQFEDDPEELFLYST